MDDERLETRKTKRYDKQERNIIIILWTEKLLHVFGGSFCTNFEDSRHAQQSKYTVFDEESDVQLKNKQILEPGGKI